MDDEGRIKVSFKEILLAFVVMYFIMAHFIQVKIFLDDLRCPYCPMPLSCVRLAGAAPLPEADWANATRAVLRERGCWGINMRDDGSLVCLRYVKAKTDSGKVLENVVETVSVG